ncbi:DUF1206 domain-containing protein [Algoriphagus sp.]|uniref:DUF1206 domain-containing protein n=1 Tax=Algoriphagus sp. TaxID=1872435 RepID=UPI0032728976
MDNSKKDKLKKVKQFGYYSKGLVYGLIGLLAAMVASGLGGEIKGKLGIAQFLYDLPGGIFLTSIVALGLVAHGVWRFYESAVDPNGEGDKTRIGPRIQFAYSGIFYTVIGFSFAQPLFNNVGSSEGSSQKAALSMLLEKDWGIWVVWGIALGMAGNALWQFYLGISAKFMVLIDKNPDNTKEYKLVKRSGRYGYIARGVVFGVISFFLVKVCIAHNASELRDTEGAFQYLLSLPYGSILMGAVALGMMGFGIFSFMVARHASRKEID